jgi:hypothetical protein
MQGQGQLNQSALTGLIHDPKVNKHQFKGITLKAAVPNIDQLHKTTPF